MIRYASDLFFVIVISALAIIAIAAGSGFTQRQSHHNAFRKRFGPEYDQTVDRLRNREVAEAARRGERNEPELSPLFSGEAQRELQTQWARHSDGFVDEPAGRWNRQMSSWRE
jgi:hypothetical protein